MFTLIANAVIVLLAVGIFRALVHFDNKRAWKRRQKLVVQQLKREWIEADREAALTLMRHATRPHNDGGRAA